ncbi:3-dehydroquinate dehydratase [bacterium]|nr:3-dehydroquinate dehydratase [bacterium]
MTKILLIEGPLLDKIGERELEIYGRAGTREALIDNLISKAGELKVELEFVQDYSEGNIASAIVNAKCDGIIINPGAYTHTSVLLRDALLAAKIPFVEVHVSNIFAREPFRHHSYLSDIAAGVICGFGTCSYAMALEGLLNKIRF